MWDKPNEFYAILRCTEVKYANMLIDTGSIKFNTPYSWVNRGENNEGGRGDILEGAFAASSLLEVDEVIKNLKLYQDVYSETINGLSYFRRRRTMELPCYCFFLLKQELFKCPDEEGIQKIVADIPASYFKDFANNKSKEDVERLTENEKPALVVINDIDKFIGMIKNKLLQIGVKESEIMIEQIEYVDKKVPFYCTGKSPIELKLKNTCFSHQSEGRIIINTDNKKIIDFLSNTPIEIGSIDKIAKMAKGYFHEGVEVEMEANIYKINDIDQYNNTKIMAPVK